MLKLIWDMKPQFQ